MNNSHKIYLYFKSVLSYYQESGIFYNRDTDEPADTIEKDGYLYVLVNDNRYKADCLAWYFVRGEWPKYPLKHINGDNSNNMIKNLRYLYIKKSLKHDGFKVTGVNMESMTTWGVNIYTGKKQKYIGTYKIFELAVIARYNAEILYGYEPNTEAHQYVKQMFL